MSDRDEQKRQKAYAIWQAAGEPHGQHDEHWAEAERQLGEDKVAAPAADDAAPAAMKKSRAKAAPAEAAAKPATPKSATPKSVAPKSASPKSAAPKPEAATKATATKPARAKKS